jgi:uncharacterized membrane protein YfcA
VSIFLPVAGVSLSLLYLIGIGTSVGLLSGLVGVGGGFLLTPALMMIGVPATVAAASGSCQMVATSSSGVAAHFRLGNVDIKIGAVLLAGGLLGAALGVQIIKVLRGLGEADLVITFAYIVVLGVLGTYMFMESLRTLRRGTMVHKSARPTRTKGILARLPWQMDFPRSCVRHSVLVPLVLSLFVGILATIMGVGGGFVMLPMMVYLLGMPTHVAVGTSLFQILFLCCGVTYMQATTNQVVDLLLALALAVGSTIGAQVGARLSRFLRGEQLIILLATVVILVVIKMTIGIIRAPANMLTPTESAGPQVVYQTVPISPRARPTPGHP